MSAREKLLHWLSGAGFVGPQAEQEADQILGAYAHGLAEKIRQEAARRHAAGVWWDSDGHFDWCEAANFIDPEASDG